ncbi:DNA primase [Bradyrhizobium sp. CCBAU 51627]|uniref:DNA primase n=1 Tax=Bradyrhizobium sp. CCBAU 51627 TaxID=1325088 RepID=UPI0023069B6F|nr:DNA primase [Bradyrhizobium sp. CCBAU 51627]MDA9430455.1 DNA primase [Bradyrhizobium sp. CCBAU 51627]
MRFPPSFLDELKARLPISDVVGRRVKLRKAGREWKGLSPFQQEKTPSFTVNDQKQFYHDFSTGKHGNIFDFVMETEGVSFPEAVERLASLAGLSLPRTSREEEQREQRQKSLYDVVELAAKYFEQNLASNVGAQARGYLSDRGISPSTTIEFRLGYATPNRFGLKEYLGSKGVSVGDMIETGLLIAGDDIPVPYDRFRDRVIIPIHDQRGRVIGFGGRALKSDVQPKYLNSPETSIFHKGSVVFNFHRAREPAYKDGSVVAVEGYMDAIAIYQAGIRGVVATMGTAFTEEQISSLWRLSSEPVVCFDADRAGVAAAHRSIERIIPMLTVGRSFRFAFMVEEKDPDDLIRERGVEAFKGVLSNSRPIWDVLWARETENVNVKNPDTQALLEQTLMKLIRTIKDPTVQNAYVRTCRLQLASLFWRSGKRQPGQESKLSRDHLRISGEGERLGVQKILLGMLVNYPNYLEAKEDRISALRFEPRLEKFCGALHQLLIEYGTLEVHDVYLYLPKEFYEDLEDIHGSAVDGKRLGHSLFARFPVLDRDPLPSFVERCIDHFISVIHLYEIREDIRETEPKAADSDEAMNRLVELVRLREDLRVEIYSEGISLAEEAESTTRIWSAGKTHFPVPAAA